jgi:hypothetical protein
MLQAVTEHTQCIDCGHILCVLHNAAEFLAVGLCADCCRGHYDDNEGSDEEDNMDDGDDDGIGDDMPTTHFFNYNYKLNTILPSATPVVCPICLESIASGSSAAALGCHVSHVFHEACISKWLEKTPHCPLCRIKT